LIIGGLAILLLGASGAVTALGDTLFPSSSVLQGMQQDFSPTAHYLIKMRVYHPAIAMSVGTYLLLVTLWVRRKFHGTRVDPISMGLIVLYGLQIVLGVTNVALLAPVWMQLLHLLVSNLVWVTFIVMTIVVFGTPLPAEATQPSEEQVKPAASTAGRISGQ
jgi:heme A synthase